MPSVKSEPPPDLALPCPDLPELKDGKAATVLLWAFDVVALYRDCQAKHRGLADVFAPL